METQVTTGTDRQVSPRGQQERSKAQTVAADENYPVLVPRVDIYEGEHDILVLADLPGVTPEGVQLDLDRGELTLEARTPAESPLGGLRWRRAFLVPRGIRTEEIRADLNDGVLTVRLPKSEETRKRTVQVSSG